MLIVCMCCFIRDWWSHRRSDKQQQNWPDIGKGFSSRSVFELTICTLTLTQSLLIRFPHCKDGRQNNQNKLPPSNRIFWWRSEFRLKYSELIRDKFLFRVVVRTCMNVHTKGLMWIFYYKAKIPMVSNRGNVWRCLWVHKSLYIKLKNKS